MRRLTIFFLLSALVFSKLCYADTFYSKSYEENRLSGSHCFLWKIESDEGRVYMLGSIHLLKQEVYPLNQKIEDAFLASDTLVVEADINQADLLTQAPILEKAMYLEGDSLERHLSEGTYQYINQKFQGIGFDINLFGQFKPWFLAMQITVINLMQLGYDPSYGIDMYFLNKAGQSKKIEELESIEYQINLLDSMSDKNQEFFLLSSTKDLDRLQEEMDIYINAWLTGDAVTLERFLFRTLIEHPEMSEMYEILFFERNRRMASKIEQLLKAGGNYFVVVGAGHLVGEDGIIKLLERKGFSVQQI